MSRKLWLGILHLFCAGLIGLPVFGETQKWSGTVTLIADQKITDDIELDGDVVVEVSSGKAYLNGVISDKDGTTGKIIKTGSGELQIRANYPTPSTPNTFSGGVEIRKGKVYSGGTSNTGKAEPHCPFGTGKIIIDRTNADTSVLDPMGCIINDIEFIGESSYSHPFLSRGGGTGFLGDVSANGDAYILGYTGRPDGSESDGKIAYNGSLAIGSEQDPKTLKFYGSTWLKLNCPVSCDTLDAYQEEGKTHSHYTGMFGGFSLYKANNNIRLVRLDQGVLNCAATGVANGFALELYGGHDSRTALTKKYNVDWDVGRVINTSYVKMSAGSTQTFQWVKSDPRDDDEPNYDFRNAGTKSVNLRITGEEDVTAECSMAISNNIALTVEAPATFTQVFSNRFHALNQPVTVTSGTLRFAGTARIPRLASLALGKNGRFELTGDQKVLEVDNLTVDGELQIAGDYTSEDFPDNIGEEVTVRVTIGIVPEVKTTAVWQGGAADDALVTDGNWVGEAAPTLVDYTSKLIFAKSGATATAADGQKAHSIVFTNAAETAEEGPSAFTFQGAGSANTRFEVCGAIDVSDSLRMTFKDVTLGTPCGYDQGAPEKGGERTLYVNTTNTSNQTYPLTLDGAVIEKPVCTTTHPNKTTYFLKTVADTYNAFKGGVTKSSGNWWTLTINSGSTLAFLGGVSCNWKTTVESVGTLVISNKPWKSASSQNGIMSINGGTVILDAAGCDFGYTAADNQDGLGLSPANGRTLNVEFRRDAIMPASKMRVSVDGTRYVRVDFRDTVQQIMGIVWGGACSDAGEKRCVFTGTEGSVLELNEAQTTNVTLGCMQFTGALGLRKLGPGTSRLFRSAARAEAGLPNDCTSTGDVSVENGVLEFEDGVTWLNGTNFTAKGSGTLKFDGARQVGKQAVFRFADEGKIDIPVGVTNRVAAVYVDGKPLADGVYSGDSEELAGRLTGGGALKVGKSGIFIFLK